MRQHEVKNQQKFALILEWKKKNADQNSTRRVKAQYRCFNNQQWLTSNALFTKKRKGKMFSLFSRRIPMSIEHSSKAIVNRYVETYLENYVSYWSLITMIKMD